MVMQHTLAFAFAIVLSFVITPLVIRFATLIKAIDVPDKRKVHGQPTPRLGGVAIFISFFAALLLAMYRFPESNVLPWVDSSTKLAILAACFVTLMLGVIDDVRQLGPGSKFTTELLICTFLYFAGVRISDISYPFGAGQWELGLLSYPVTVLWIIGIMNALNLIDGLDGLAAGASIVASITMCAVLYSMNDPGSALIALTLAGAVLGFLRHNFNPAKIFLGDSGSLFLGFVLAVLSIVSWTKGSTAFAISIPVLALGLPIMDTTLAVVRRMLRPLLPDQKQSLPLLRVLKSIFLPDRDHIHHRLLALGLSQRSAVLLLYVVSSALGCTAFGLSVTSKVGSSVIFILVMTALFYGVRQLNYREIAILRNGALLPFYERPLLQRRAFQVFVDLAFAATSYWLSWFFILRNRVDSVSGGQLLLYSAVSVLAQMIILWNFGLYRGMYRHASIADALRITKAVLIAVTITGAASALLGDWSPQVTVTVLTMNFFFLLTFVSGWRFSFSVLSHLNQQQGDGKKKVLIYGAGYRGAAALRLMLNSPSLQISPIGFIDDNPGLEGKRMYGYEVFGGHWKIQRLINVAGVDEIVIAAESLRPQVVERLKSLSRSNRITLKTLRVVVESEPVEVKREPKLAPVMSPHMTGDRESREWPERLVPAVSWNRL
jgi:UDP-GlcNAc:undecaprenyl-phosphate GlcNAc-1-phosphate transferase